MVTDSSFFETVFEVLESDEDLCYSLIRSVGLGIGSVDLIHGRTSCHDALCFARTLVELGRVDEAEEVLRAVWDAASDVDAHDNVPYWPLPQSGHYIN